MASRVTHLLREANTRYRQGDKKGAARLLRQVLALDPQQPLAWYGLAQCTEDPHQQRVYLEQALNLKPDFERARAKLERLAATPASAPRRVQRPSRASTRSWLVPALGALVGLLAMLVCGLSWDTYRYVAHQRATTTATACREQFYDDMLYLLSRFFRQQSIVENTPRITLAPQIARLEELRDEAWNMPTKGCAPRVHARLMDYMDKTIAGYTEFLGDNDLGSFLLLKESLKALADLDDEVIRDGHRGGLLPLFQEKGYFYWEILEEPHWKENLQDQ